MRSLLACCMLFAAVLLLPAPARAASPLVVAVNASAVFTGTGYTVGERISLWTTDPAGVASALDGIVADANGRFSMPVSFPSDGTWHVTAHGTSSGIEVVGTYMVGAAAASATAPIGVPLPAAGAYPQAAPGAAVAFSGGGFSPNETLAFWQTAPDSTVGAIPAPTGADGSGAFSTTVTFSTAGFWQVTAHGLSSGHEVVGRYVITGSAIATASGSPATVAPPVPAKVNSGVSVTGAGFDANELVSAWTTAPDSTVAALDGAQADANGSAIATAVFATAGVWQVTLHGLSSGHEVIVRYQVA